MDWRSIKTILVGSTKTDRKIRKFLYGVEELPKLPLRGRIVKGVLSSLLLASWSVMLISMTWFMATGALPFGPQPVSIVPPGLQTNVTAEQAEQVIRNSPLDLASYGEKNNCVEMAFLAARQLWWEGYESKVVRIDFSEGLGHMVVGVPTIDAGWKFYDPTGDIWVSPIVGGFFMNKQIVGIYYLYDFVWMPIEVEQP